MIFWDRALVKVLRTQYTFHIIFRLTAWKEIQFFLKNFIKKNASYIYLKCEPTYNHFSQVKIYAFEQAALQFQQTFRTVSYVLVFTENTTWANSVAECELDGLPPTLSTLLSSHVLTPFITLEEKCFERGKKKCRDRHACSLGERVFLSIYFWSHLDALLYQHFM